MKMKSLGRIVCSAIMMIGAAAPALALDYEAKPVMWVLQAPFRTAGALSGAAVSGLVSGPIEGGYHGSHRGMHHVAGKFGDEKGVSQQIVAFPLGGGTGMVLGGAESGFKGAKHGWKTGWEKPFSRWSYITMEEK